MFETANLSIFVWQVVLKMRKKKLELGDGEIN